MLGAASITELRFTEIHFEPPAPFPPEALQRLKDAERLQPVTLPELLRTGAREFCWLVPGETFAADGGDGGGGEGGGGDASSVAYGGFVYTLQESPPIVFGVSNPLEYERKAKQRAVGRIQAQQRGKRERSVVHAAIEGIHSGLAPPTGDLRRESNFKSGGGGGRLPVGGGRLPVGGPAPPEPASGEAPTPRLPNAPPAPVAEGSAEGSGTSLAEALARVAALEEKLAASSLAQHEAEARVVELQEALRRGHHRKAETHDGTYGGRLGDGPPRPPSDAVWGSASSLLSMGQRSSQRRFEDDATVESLKARLAEQGHELHMLKDVVRLRDKETRRSHMQISALRRRQALMSTTRAHHQQMPPVRREPPPTMMQQLPPAP